MESRAVKCQSNAVVARPSFLLVGEFVQTEAANQAAFLDAARVARSFVEHK